MKPAKKKVEWWRMTCLGVRKRMSKPINDKDNIKSNSRNNTKNNDKTIKMIIPIIVITIIIKGNESKLWKMH